MKKIDVSALLGTLGAPFLKQTFVHTDEQVKEVVDALVKSLISTYTTNDVIILHGCVISGTTTKAITEGAIYYNGEVYLVDAASGLTAGADTWIFAVVTTYAAGDPVTYDDSTSHNQHRIDKIAFQVGDSGSDGYIADWDDAIVKNIFDVIYGTWIDATPYLTNSYTAGPSRAFKYRKSIDGTVQFRGGLQSPASGSNIQFMTLPSDLRPGSTWQFPSCGNNSSSGNYVMTIINSTGICSIQHTTGGTTFIGNTEEFNIFAEWSVND